MGELSDMVFRWIEHRHANQESCKRGPNMVWSCMKLIPEFVENLTYYRVDGF